MSRSERIEAAAREAIARCENAANDVTAAESEGGSLEGVADSLADAASALRAALALPPDPLPFGADACVVRLHALNEDGSVSGWYYTGDGDQVSDEMEARDEMQDDPTLRVVRLTYSYSGMEEVEREDD